jgi:hypothetical protein
MQKTCTCRFLHGAETSERVRQQVDKALEGQHEYQGEVCFYMKNGEHSVNTWWPSIQNHPTTSIFFECIFRTMDRGEGEADQNAVWWLFMFFNK